MIGPCLDKHLALGARLGGGAEDRHGLAVTRELQGELFLHQLPDHLLGGEEEEVKRWREGGDKEKQILSESICLREVVRLELCG